MNNNSMGFYGYCYTNSVLISLTVLSGVENMFPDWFSDIKQSTVVDNSPIDPNAGDNLLLTVVTQQ